jgi:hypothetical protein
MSGGEPVIEKKVHIISLGAGVQSSTMALMAATLDFGDDEDDEDNDE